MESSNACSSQQPEEDGALSQCCSGDYFSDDEFGDPGPSPKAINFAGSLVARVRERCGKPPCGWSLQLWDAELTGGNEGGTPVYVHDKTGWYSSLMPEETSWEDGGRKTWSQIGVGTLWSERCFPESEYYFRFGRSGEDRLVARALQVLPTQAQQWEGALGGDGHVELPRLLLQALGPSFKPSFLGKVIGMPQPVQRQIELFLGSEIVTLLSDARALVKCFGLDMLAEELGVQLGRALDLWQAELQRLVSFTPRVIVQKSVVQCLELHDDGTFAHRVYSQHDGTRGYRGRAAVEEGTWHIHRESGRLEHADWPFRSVLFEGSVILEGTRQVVDTEDLELEEDGAREEPVKRVIGCGELHEWAEEGHARAQDVLANPDGRVAAISYLPSFEGAVEAYLRFSLGGRAGEGVFCSRLRRHISELHHFFREDVDAEFF